MEPFSLLVIVIASVLAVRAGGLKTRDMYRGKRDAWDKANPNGPWLRRRTAMLAAAAQIAKNGWPTIKESIKDGYAEGKAKGQAKVDGWRPDPEAARQPVNTNQPTPPAGNSAPTGSPTPIPRRPPMKAAPRPTPTRPPQTRTRPASPATPAYGGIPAMAEVTNPETLLAALQQKLSRASAEVEDAAATKARAEGERAYTQLILASMGRHGFPQDHMAIVTALVDPETQAYEAAKAREAAAVTALAAAQKAVDMAALHVQLKASGAAGAFYGNK